MFVIKQVTIKSSSLILSALLVVSSPNLLCADDLTGLPLDDPGFTQGWHGAEPGVRWSAGDAVLRLPPGSGILDLHVAHPS